jgi:collagen type VII alpha
VANRRISEFSSIPGLDIDEQDLLTLVHVFEVDPVLRNKKITFTEFKNYLDLYYPSTAGGTFSGNVLINGNLTVTGTSTFTSLTSSNLGTFSGIVVQNNAIVSGTVSGNTVTGNNVQASIFNAATGTFSTVATGTTAAFTTGAFVALTGITTQGTSATYTNGTFTNLTGTTITGTTVNATTGNFQEIVTPSLNVANLTVSGLTVTGTAIFASGVTVTGTLSGTTVTGTTAQFTNVTGVSGVFTSQVSGAVITGDTVRSTTITGVSGTFTSSVSGATVTGNTGAFSNLTGVSGVFTQRISGDTITGNTILLSNVTGVSGVFTTQVSGATLTGNTVNATFLNAISGDFGRVSGTTITGNAGQFTSATGVSGVFTTQLSGATITGNIGQFASLTGATGTFTTSISGTTVTGDTIKGTNITGIAGVFTTSVSGSTITGNTIQGTSGVFQNISGNTITGTTISAGLVQAISGAFTNIVFINTVISGDLRVLGSGYIVSGLEVSGQISGYTVTATGGNFTSLTGTTTTGTNANFATGTFQVINATTHNVSGNLTVTGALGVSGTATFATGVNVSGTLSGVTVTGSTAQFTTGTFISLTGTTAQGTTSTYTTGSFTSLTGTTTTGTTANFASGVFTTSVSGTTVIASTGTFTSLTGTTTQGTTATYTTGSFTSLTGTTTTGTTSSFTSGVFTTLSGATATFTSGIIASGTAAAPSLAILGDPDTGVFSPGANQLAVATNGVGRLFVNSNGDIGLGTSSPDVFGRFYTRAIGLSSSGSTSLQINAATGSNAVIDLGVNSTRTVGITSNVSETQFSTLTATPIIVGTNGGERVRITSAGLVGIGTSSPSQLLHLNKTGSSCEMRITSSSADFLIQTGDAGDDGLHFYDMTNSAYRMMISNAGNVGIGTISPSGLIHGYIDANAQLIFQNSSQNNLYVSGTNATVVVDATGSSYPGFLIKVGGTLVGSLGVDGTSTLDIASNSGVPITFKPASTERARIDTSGRLLVGTSTARSNFFNGPDTAGFQLEGTGATNRFSAQIYGNGSVTGPYQIFAKHGGIAVGSTTLVSSGDEIGGLSFQGSDGTEFVEGARITAYVDGTPGANDMPGRLVFSTTADGASSPTERLRITSAGQIQAGGLGTAAAPVLSFLSDTNTGIYSPGADYVALSTAGTGRLFVDSSGKVGVGSLFSPDGGVPRLWVDHNSESTLLVNTSGSGSRAELKFRNSNSNGEARIYNITGGPLAFYNTSTESLRITSAGLVGIGTTSPEGKLEVSAGNAEGLRLSSPSYLSTSQGPWIAFNGGPSAGWDLARVQGIRRGSDAEGALVFYTNNGGGAPGTISEKARIDEAGRLGIGTSSPGAGLHIATAGQTTSALDTSGSLNLLVSDTGASAGNGGSIVFGYNSGSGRFASIKGQVITGAGNSTGHLTFSTRNATSDATLTERMRIDSVGQILASSLGTAAVPVWSFTGDPNTGIYSPGADQLAVATNGVGRLFVADNGNVGVGTSPAVARINLSASGAGIPAIQFTDNANATGRIGTPSSGLVAFGGNTDHAIAFGGWAADNFTSERLRITAAGLVGIGTSSPASTLHVAGTFRNTGQAFLGIGEATTLAYIGDPFTTNTRSIIFNRASGVTDIVNIQGLNAGVGLTDIALQAGGGRVGIGTASPTYSVEVQNTVSSDVLLRIRNVQGNEDTGLIIDGDSGGTQREYRIGVNTITNTPDLTFSGPTGFRWFTAGTEKAQIDTSGRLLVGTSTAINIETGLAVKADQSNGGAGVAHIRNSLASGADASPCLVLSKTATTTSSSARFIQFFASDSATPMGGIVGNGASNVQFATLSDIRDKENIQPLAGSLDKIKQVEVVAYDWKASGEHVNAGFIAQNIETIFPEYVVENMTGEGDDDRKGVTGGLSSGYVAVLTAALQEAVAKIETLEAAVAALQQS